MVSAYHIFSATDKDDDYLKVEESINPEDGAIYLRTNTNGAYLTADQVDELIAKVRPYGERSLDETCDNLTRTLELVRRQLAAVTAERDWLDKRSQHQADRIAYLQGNESASLRKDHNELRREVRDALRSLNALLDY